MGIDKFNTNNDFLASVRSYIDLPQNNSNHYFLKDYSNNSAFDDEDNDKNQSELQTNLKQPNQAERKRKLQINQTQPKDSILMCAAEAIPQIRRFEGVSNKVEDGDYSTALASLGLLAINLPPDWIDVKSSYYQIREHFKHDGKYKSKYDQKMYQHDFSFFKDTAIEKWIHKQGDSGKHWANWLLDNDVTLADTRIGNKITDTLKIKEGAPIATKIKDFNNNPIFGYSYEGTLFKELTGRAMRRTTKLGLIATCLLESPKIINAIKKGDSIGEKTKNAVKQTAKSGINITATTAGIAYGGAIGAKYGKTFGSLVGMGLGAILGSKLSSGAQSLIP